MKFLTYFGKDKPELLPFTKTVKVKVPRISLELYFCGKNDEVEIYNEILTANHFYLDHNDYLDYIVKEIQSHKFVTLNGSNVTLTEYFTLMKVILKDVNYVEVNQEVTEYKYNEEQ